MSRVLLTGIAVLDIVNRVEHFPMEDEEMRALDNRAVRGGNAANSSAILAQGGHEVYFLGTLAQDSSGDALNADLTQRGVRTNYCPRLPGSTPTSYVTVNEQTGSRTIVHYRDLPELSLQHFDAVDCRSFDAFHFEGRNIGNTRAMLDTLLTQRVDQPVTVEIEKPRDGIDALFHGPDVLLFSRAYARALGFDSADSFLRAQRQLTDALLLCTWAERGAYALDANDQLLHAPAADVTVVDTLGAGDSFNAGLLHALCQGKPFADSLQFAQSVAERKVQQQGFEGLLT